MSRFVSEGNIFIIDRQGFWISVINHRIGRYFWFLSKTNHFTIHYWNSILKFTISIISDTTNFDWMIFSTFNSFRNNIFIIDRKNYAFYGFGCALIDQSSNHFTIHCTIIEQFLINFDWTIFSFRNNIFIIDHEKYTFYGFGCAVGDQSSNWSILRFLN